MLHSTSAQSTPWSLDNHQPGHDGLRVVYQPLQWTPFSGSSPKPAVIYMLVGSLLQLHNERTYLSSLPPWILCKIGRDLHADWFIVQMANTSTPATVKAVGSLDAQMASGTVSITELLYASMIA